MAQTNSGHALFNAFARGQIFAAGSGSGTSSGRDFDFGTLARFWSGFIARFCSRNDNVNVGFGQLALKAKTARLSRFSRN